MSHFQRELVQERVCGIALHLACHAGDNHADRTTWAAALLLGATRDLAAPECSAVRCAVQDLLEMFEASWLD